MTSNGRETAVSVEKSLLVLMALFITSLTASNLTASKIVFLGEISGITLLSPAAVVAYAATFLFTDIISEVWGKRVAGHVVFAGFISQLLLVFLVNLAILLPIAPFQGQEFQEAYARILGPSWYIVVGGLVAYLVSQYHDIWAFHMWRKRTKGRWLWLRNNASTMVSQLIDTAIFITLAFGALPQLALGSPIVPWNSTPGLIAGQYIVKLIIALLDTPFCYLGVHLVKKTSTQLPDISNT